MSVLVFLRLACISAWFTQLVSRKAPGLRCLFDLNTVFRAVVGKCCTRKVNNKNVRIFGRETFRRDLI